MKKKITPLKWKKQDPFRIREIKNYGKNPLPSREFIISCLEKKKVSSDISEIAKSFSLSKSEREFFNRRIKAMLRDEELFLKNNKLRVNKKLNFPINLLLTEKKKKSFSITKALRKQFNNNLIEKYNLPHKFSEEIINLAKKFPKNPNEDDFKNREDWRKYSFITIDGVNSRDFDDAVYCTKRGENFRLFVAIADVSYYVKKGDFLDMEAQRRGTSVYFPEMVIPMLPEELSNGLCSLNPNCERLVLGVVMHISENGEIKKAKFSEAVINSKARLTYEEVELMLFEKNKEKSENLRKKYKKVLNSLENLKSLFLILKKARTKRNAINFSFPEAQAIFDSKGNIKTIQAGEHLNSHQLIEECMVAANIKAAQLVAEAKIPALFRVHSEPPEKKLERLRPFLLKMGLKGLKMPKNDEDWSAEKFNQIISLAENKEQREILELMILRSLAPALYEPQNLGHFALALKDYAHFTSPIRRYPDLLLHRAIKFILKGGNKEEYFYNLEQMQNFGISCSETERRAEEVSRKAMDFLKCEFISNYLGEIFTGKISSITKFGIFVSLDKFLIDGLVHIRTLPDYYIFNPDNQTLTGEYSGEIFKIGEKVKIKVASVNIEECKIDFELYQHKTNKEKRKNKK